MTVDLYKLMHHLTDKVIRRMAIRCYGTDWAEKHLQQWDTLTMLRRLIQDSESEDQFIEWYFDAVSDDK